MGVVYEVALAGVSRICGTAIGEILRDGLKLEIRGHRDGLRRASWCGNGLPWRRCQGGGVPPSPRIRQLPGHRFTYPASHHLTSPAGYPPEQRAPTLARHRLAFRSIARVTPVPRSSTLRSRRSVPRHSATADTELTSFSDFCFRCLVSQKPVIRATAPARKALWGAENHPLTMAWAFPSGHRRVVRPPRTR